MGWRAVSAFLLPGFLVAPLAAQQAPPSSPYTLRIPVDEISLTFHAADAHGVPLTHLRRDDIRLTDDGKAQTNIVMLEALNDLPIRAGFLFDTSRSMLGGVAFNGSIIRTYASQLLRKGYDRAFVEQFDTATFMRQNWTDSDSGIATGAAAVGDLPGRYEPLTAIFDSLYTTCRDQWKADPDQPTGNFILLFSDGEDDDSHAYMSEAVDMCQRTRTAIYAIAYLGRRGKSSEGFRTLQDLTQQTGGRLFVNPQGGQILEDLKVMEAEQRNQYRLVYKASNFTADKTFHRIGVECTVAGAHVTARSGYYAFARP